MRILFWVVYFLFYCAMCFATHYCFVKTFIEKTTNSLSFIGGVLNGIVIAMTIIAFIAFYFYTHQKELKK